MDRLLRLGSSSSARRDVAGALFAAAHHAQPRSRRSHIGMGHHLLRALPPLSQSLGARPRAGTARPLLRGLRSGLASSPPARWAGIFAVPSGGAGALTAVLSDLTSGQNTCCGPRNLKPQPPQPIHAGMRNGRGRHAPLLPPGPSVENPGDGCQQHIAPVEMRHQSPFIEMRESEQDRRNHQRGTPSDTPLEQVLHPPAKEKFFGHSGKEKDQNPAQDRTANSRNYDEDE